MTVSYSQVSTVYFGTVARAVCAEAVIIAKGDIRRDITGLHDHIGPDSNWTSKIMQY